MRTTRQKFTAVATTEQFLYGVIFSATMIYMIGLGFTPLQLVLVGTALELTILLFEIPTGIVADRFGRKRSVLIGFSIVGVAYLVMAGIPRFWGVMLGSALWGFGYTFVSGAFHAWLVDEIGQAEAEPTFARIGRNGAIVSLVGMGIGAGLGTLSVRIPILVGAVGFVVLAIVVRQRLDETRAPSTRTTPSEAGHVLPEANPFREMGQLARDAWRGIRGSSVLIALIPITIIMGAYSEGYDRLHEARLVREIGLPASFEPIVWLAVIGVASSLLGSTANHWLEKRIAAIRRPGLPLAAITGAIALLIVLFVVLDALVPAILALVLVGALRRVSGPLMAAWTNRHVKSEVRATVLSFFGQADALGQVSFGPLAGFIGSRFGVGWALITSAVVLVPAMMLYAATGLSSRARNASSSDTEEP